MAHYYQAGKYIVRDRVLHSGSSMGISAPYVPSSLDRSETGMLSQPATWVLASQTVADHSKTSLR